MYSAFELTGNASSIHAEGRGARALVEDSRLIIAHATGTAAKNIVFTSGATEAVNLVLTPDIATDDRDLRPFDQLFASAGEHPAVLKGHRFAEANFALIPLLASGIIDLGALNSAVGWAKAQERRIMLALQAANNESGVIQPLAKAAEIIHAAGGLVICDAAQAAGKIACNFSTFPADAIALSAHKFGGPKGAGALCFSSDFWHITQPLLRGGGQERGLRAGTENIAAIHAMAAALKSAEDAREDEASRLSAWRNEMEAAIRQILPEAIVFGAAAERLPNTSCFAIPGIEAQLLLIALDLEGFAVSSGSACSSGKVKASHVLRGMGVEAELAGSAIRVSVGWDTREDECLSFVEALQKTVASIRGRRRRPAA